MGNIHPRPKPQGQVLEACLENRSVQVMVCHDRKDWEGKCEFPEYVGACGETTKFTTAQPIKTGVIYKGHNQNGVPCAWLLAFRSLGVGTPPTVYVDAGEVDKFKMVDWESVSYKLDRGDYKAERQHPLTGAFIKASIHISPTTQAVTLSVLFGDKVT